MRTIILLSLTVGLAHAAPSTLLESEFFIPLESQPTQFALADVQTGEIRTSNVNPDGSITPLHRFPSHLPFLTGIGSGFTHLGNEYLTAANVTSNRIALVPIDGSAIISVPTLIPGPSHPALVRATGASPIQLATSSRYHTTGNTLELILDPATAPTTSDLWTDWPTITEVQPVRAPSTGRRFLAAAAQEPGGGHRLLTFSQSGSSLSLKGDEKLTTTRIVGGVIGEDGRVLVLGFTPGQPQIVIFTIDPTTAGITYIAQDTIPFNILSISPVEVPGQPHGIAITGTDSTIGSISATAEILNGESINILDFFNASSGKQITGLTPIPGIGLVQLERSSSFFGPSSSFITHQWNGSKWEPTAKGNLAPYSDATNDFATLFWYIGNPLTDPNATLVSLETRNAWTRPSNANKIPATIFGESFVSTTTGLGNPSSFSPTNPGGADHLFTNQFSPSVSLAALTDRNQLLTPALRISHDSGYYEDPIFITATYDFESQDLYYREDRPGSPWRIYDSGFPLAYPGTFLFHTQSKDNNTQGPIIRRDYYFNYSGTVGPDSDDDGVPDIVERKYNLNPLSGPDSDGDGRSDLEEILDGTDPNNDASFTPRNPLADLGPDGTRSASATSDGFQLFAQAKTQSTGIASPGEELTLRDTTGALLRTAPIAALTGPPTLTGQLAATLHHGLPVDSREWLVLHTPTFFNLGTGVPAPRTGVEQYRVIATPIQEPPAINPPGGYSGFDLAADADAWINAARLAYASYHPLTEITEIRPKHNASAVIAEAIIHEALIIHTAASELGVPADPDLFTLFGARPGDRERSPYTREMQRALLRAGFDFPTTIGLVDSELETVSSSGLRSLTSVLRNHHVAQAETIPDLGFPIDALRTLLNTGALPANYASVTTPAAATAARTRMLEIIGTATSFRPTDTWNITVDPSYSTGGSSYTFTRQPDYTSVQFFDSNGEPFTFQQGLGLRVGTTITVTGYTDLPPVGAFSSPAMEIISIDSITIPASSNSDTDANFLDDDWELFFFGETGIDPYATPQCSPYTYLQFFLTGADPRDPSSLTGPVLDFSLPALRIVRQLDESFAIEWDWPTEFADRFNFNLQQSTTLTGFGSSISTAEPLIHAPGILRLPLDPSLTAPPANFFRLDISLR